MEPSYVTVKVSKEAHEELRKLRHVFFVDTYPDVVDKLLQEYRQKHDG